MSKLHALGIIYSPAEERFDRITSVAREVFQVPIALVSLVSQKCQWFKSAQGLTAAETPREISFCGHAILQEDTFVVPDAGQHPDFSDNPLVTGEPFIRFYAGHPLMYEGSPMGTLCLIDRKPRELTPTQLDMLRSLAAWAESELKVTAFSAAQSQLLKELDESRRQGLINPLTKTWNQNGFDMVMHGELDRARSSQQRVALLSLDVDRLKDVNDSYGREAGDLTLVEVAKRIRSSGRPSNVLAHSEDDQFLLFVPDCRGETAKILAERILTRVRVEPIRAGTAKFHVSLTIGVASSSTAGTLDAARLRALADEALREAKSAGRDCFRIKSRD